MISAEAAIARLRRDLAVVLGLKLALVGVVVLAGAADLLLEQPVIRPSLALAAAGVVWIYLSYRSVAGTRLVAMSPALIASGRYEQAERQIEEALRTFSLFRIVKLRSVYHLAALRQAQGRFAEAAALCRAVLARPLRGAAELERSARLTLAGALLELEDARGAYEALLGLYRHRLPLGQALELLALQTDYLARIEAWEQMVEGLGRKVELTELMPAVAGMRTQALLGLAARKAGRPRWAEYLRRRVELLGEAQELIAWRGAIGQLWAG